MCILNYVLIYIGKSIIDMSSLFWTEYKKLPDSTCHIVSLYLDKIADLSTLLLYWRKQLYTVRSSFRRGEWKARLPTGRFRNFLHEVSQINSDQFQSLDGRSVITFFATQLYQKLLGNADYLCISCHIVRASTSADSTRSKSWNMNFWFLVLFIFYRI
jgi:hypothetical protein